MSSMCSKKAFHLENNQDFTAAKNMVCEAVKSCRDAGSIYVLTNLYSKSAGTDDNLFRHPPY